MTSTTPHEARTEPYVPTALSEPTPRRAWYWLLPLAAVLLSAYLMREGLGRVGTTIRVQTLDGHGIRIGDGLRHLGIEVGTIEDVRLGATLETVVLEIRLAPNAAAVARDGSRFWIVRPELGLDSVSGLETIVGARYVAVQPGPLNGEPRTEFVALHEPPVDERVEADGLQIVLEAPARYGIQPGAALEYRQVRIGTVLAVGLASDASSVEMRVYVRPGFVELVREGSVFWESGGVEVDIGLTSGVHLGIDSLRSILVGSIQMATPPSGGGVVRTGRRFPLHEEPEPDWLAWRPNLPVGPSTLAPGASPPRLHRVKLTWREGRFLKRGKEREGWLLQAPGGWIGPLDLLRVPEDAVDEVAYVEVDGGQLALGPGDRLTDLGDGLGRLSIGASGASSLPEPTYRRMEAPEDFLVVRDAGAESLAIDASRLAAAEGGGFEIDRAIGLDEAWHGALALAREDGAALGMLLVEKKRVRLARFP